jgi:hypothetical protein
MKHSCAHSFDFAFELDQNKDTTIQKYIAMIHVAVLQSAMIFGYSLAVCNHNPETSNECIVLYGALYPTRSAILFEAWPIIQSQLKGACPCKIGGLVEIPTAET